MRFHHPPSSPCSKTPEPQNRFHRWFHAIAGMIPLLAFMLWIVIPLGAAHASGLLVAEGRFGGVFEIKEHNVRVTINNGVAVTEVEQIFLNTENRTLEALYTFPVPKNASVANFSMWINGVEMIGEVVEKERAREIYDSYKRVGRDPGLLEQVDYKTFEMRIFPIGPRAEQRVKVTYYQELDIDHDWATYVYPLATVTRRDIDQRTTGRFSLSIDVRSAVPIVEMSSPSHKNDFVTASHSEQYWQASLETTGGDLSRDVVLAYHLSRPQTGIDLITSRQRGEDGYFEMTLTVGEDLAKLDVGMDYVFILDVSGSMAQDGKLQLSTDGIDEFIKALGDEDRFEIISFNVKPTTLFDQLSAVNKQSQKQASDFLASRDARGGTTLKPALDTAYRYGDPDRTLNIVIFSDGMTEQRERRALLQMIGRRPGSSRVFCIGVGNEVNRPLLRQLAERAGGLAAFLSHGDDFSRQARAFRRKLTRPAATKVQIAFDGGGVYDLVPEKLPNLYHGSPIRLYGRYRNDGPVNVTLSADVRGRPLSQSAVMELPRMDAANPEIDRMWAWHQVERLLNEADEAGSRDRAIDEIVTLGEGYSIATEYTSFIVLENDQEYKRWKIKQRNATRIARDRRSRDDLRAQLDTMRNSATADLGPQKNGQRSREESNPTIVSQRPGDSQPQISQRRSSGPRNAPNSWNLNMPSGGGQGGGAIDPVTGAIILTLVGSTLAAHRRRRRS